MPHRTITKVATWVDAPECERMFYHHEVAHRVDPDGIMISRLLGVSSRRAGRGVMPEGDALEAALDELRKVATEVTQPGRWSPYPPRRTLRTDLLGQAAGAIAGSPDRDQHDEVRVELLRLAGADADEMEKARQERAERAQRSGPPFSRPAPRRDGR